MFCTVYDCYKILYIIHKYFRKRSACFLARYCIYTIILLGYAATVTVINSIDHNY
jgi:hypothetical protein